MKIKNYIFDKPPVKTILYYAEDQDIYDTMVKTGAIDEMYKGSPSAGELRKLVSPYKKGGSCVVIDDSMHKITSDLTLIFTTLSHHLNCSVIFIVQNLFVNSPEYRTISLNATYCFIMRNRRNEQQVQQYAKQVSLYGTSYIIQSFRERAKSPYSYLFFDFKPGTPHHLMVRSCLLPQEFPIEVYLEKEFYPE